MSYPSNFLVQTIVRLFRHAGVEQLVLSPGSRNAPLMVGFSEDPSFECHSVVDERSAAFFALGLAQASKKPVAVVCTSGSAVVNYFPAVAEAFYSDIPLIVVSADRPSQLIEIGDGQTLRPCPLGIGGGEGRRPQQTEGAHHVTSSHGFLLLFYG